MPLLPRNFFMLFQEVSACPISLSTPSNTSLMASGGAFKDRISFRWSDLIWPTARRAASMTGATTASSASTSPFLLLMDACTIMTRLASLQSQAWRRGFKVPYDKLVFVQSWTFVHSRASEHSQDMQQFMHTTNLRCTLESNTSAWLSSKCCSLPLWPLECMMQHRSQSALRSMACSVLHLANRCASRHSTLCVRRAEFSM